MKKNEHLLLGNYKANNTSKCLIKNTLNVLRIPYWAKGLLTVVYLLVFQVCLMLFKIPVGPCSLRMINHGRYYILIQVSSPLDIWWFIVDSLYFIKGQQIPLSGDHCHRYKDITFRADSPFYLVCVDGTHILFKKD